MRTLAALALVALLGASARAEDLREQTGSFWLFGAGFSVNGGTPVAKSVPGGGDPTENDRYSISGGAIYPYASWRAMGDWKPAFGRLRLTYTSGLYELLMAGAGLLPSLVSPGAKRWFDSFGDNFNGPLFGHLTFDGQVWSDDHTRVGVGANLGDRFVEARQADSVIPGDMYVAYLLIGGPTAHYDTLLGKNLLRVRADVSFTLMDVGWYAVDKAKKGVKESLTLVGLYPEYYWSESWGAYADLTFGLGGDTQKYFQMTGGLIWR